jgi:PAS domain S-box-containing protein
VDTAEADLSSGLDPRWKFLRGLVDSLPAMVAYWDADLRCRFANRAYEKWFGVQPHRMIGRGMEEFLGPLFALNRPYIEGVLRGEEQEFEREIPDPAGGSPRHSQAHYIPDVEGGVVRGFCVLVADITRRKRAEEAVQRLQAQVHASARLAALATLAGGLAHEINNPLAAVLANVGMALESLDREEALRTALLEIRTGSERVRDIVRGMRILARSDSNERELVDVDDAVEKSIAFATPVLRYRARLVRSLGRPGYVEAVPSHLVQVLVNLLVNASQALPEERAEANEVCVSTSSEAGQVVIEVRDNGRGIPDALQSRIFEPFFTTRDVGAGTGLGLSICHGIVTSSGGTLSVVSQVGRGSTFRIVLPAVAGARVARPAALPVHAPDPTSLLPPARPRLLVIDDEPVLTRILQRGLAKEFDVVTVNRGRDALAALAPGREPFDLILCDLMMPEFSGQDVYEEVTRQSPELARRFVFMTGGAFTPRSRQFLESVQAPVLDKPFNVSQVGQRLATRFREARGPAVGQRG